MKNPLTPAGIESVTFQYQFNIGYLFYQTNIVTVHHHAYHINMASQPTTLVWWNNGWK